jgi:predicted dehydrogenase
MDSKRKRWGVVGLGIGEQHALALAEVRHLDVTAICDSDPARLERVRSVLPDATPFASAEQLINSGIVDAVVIATYDSKHGRQVIEALSLGLDVFVEKPIATSRAELLQIVELLNRNRSLRLSTNTLLRAAYRFAWLKSAIARGLLGELVHASMTYQYGRLPKLLDGWRGNEEDYSVTLGGTIHMIDLILWLADEFPSEVFAIGSDRGLLTALPADAPSKGIQDVRVGLLKFESGFTAHVGANFSCVMPHFHEASLFGTSGTFAAVPPLAAHLGPDIPASGAWFYSSRDPKMPPQLVDGVCQPVPKGTLLVAFASGGPMSASVVTEQQAVDATAVALALDESVASGAPVSVEYVPVQARTR